MMSSLDPAKTIIRERQRRLDVFRTILEALYNDLSLTTPDTEVLSHCFCFLSFTVLQGSQEEVTVLYLHCEREKYFFRDKPFFFLLPLSLS